MRSVQTWESACIVWDVGADRVESDGDDDHHRLPRLVEERVVVRLQIAVVDIEAKPEEDVLRGLSAKPVGLSRR